MSKPIYVPKGKAKEYGDYAINIYTGCPHRCFYCFAPNVLHRDRETFHTNVKPRENIVEEVRKQIEREHITGRLIHLWVLSHINSFMVVMTRDGFTLLVMGYNGKLAMKFKEAYIKQFNAMESVLRKKMIARERGRASREFLTDSIQQSDEDARMHGHAYSTYTNCIYKVLFGKSAAQLRMDYGIGRTDNLRDCFSPEDLAAVDSMEHLVSGLVACGWEYGRIKDFIEQTNTQKALMA